MSDLILQLAKREAGKGSASEVRAAAQVPGVMYGHGIEPVAIAVDRSTFAKVYDAGGESTLIDLVIDGAAAVKGIIKTVQRDPLTHEVIHIDLMQVNMNEKLRTEVELVFEGESEAVKNLNGILVTNTDTLEIECLPSNLVHQIVVDISSLKTFDDAIHVKELTFPDGVEPTAHADEVIVSVTAPRVEKEVEAAPAAEGEAEKDGAPAAEGEAEKSEDSK